MCLVKGEGVITLYTMDGVVCGCKHLDQLLDVKKLQWKMRNKNTMKPI